MDSFKLIYIGKPLELKGFDREVKSNYLCDQIIYFATSNIFILGDK